jgi:ABC-type sugar transport system ATPase subunit
MSAMDNPKLLLMQGMSKSFPGVQALKNVDFEVRRGEVMALVGENGAGKSTLIKILSGAQPGDTGTITINGQPADITTPKDAQKAGVAVIYQELELAEHLSVAENIFVGREPKRGLGLIDYNKMYRDAEKLLEQLHIKVNPRTEVRKLSIARKQMVEISRALSMDATIIIMDEPTSSLPTTSATLENEVDVLLNLIGRLRDNGKSIIYISHRMDEIFRISDRITVLRDGQLVGVVNTADTNPDKVVAMMVGRELEDLYGARLSDKVGETVVKLQDLNGVSFSVRSGEIVGLSGLIGSGRTELALTIFGSLPRAKGHVFVDGKQLDANSPEAAIAAGMGYVPEDRKAKGLFLEKAIRLNIAAATVKEMCTRFGFVRTEKERETARQYIDTLGIRTPSMEQKARNLSGGNQQKVVLGKWLAMKPRFLILDEPTRGVDVGAKAEIYSLMRKMVEQGLAILMISSELNEILAMSDRIVVMREGKYMGTLDAVAADEEKVMALATGTTIGV